MIDHTAHLMIRTPLYFIILFIGLTTGCSLANAPVTLATATPTITPISRAGQPMTPAPTISPTSLPSLTPTHTPLLPPPSATPTAITRQGDRLPRTSTGDSILPPATNTPAHSAGLTIPCAVASEALNLREGPGTSYSPIAVLPAGATVSARKCYPGAEWLLVETVAQEIGWAKTSLLACQGDPSQLPIAGGIIAGGPSPAASVPTPAPTPTPVTAADDDSQGEPPAVGILPPPALNAWRAEYYDNASLLGNPVLIRQDPDLDFNWILDSPAPNIPADNFSARWTRLFDFFEGGDYRFFADADDGVRVYVDGWLVIDEWNTDRPVTHVGEFANIKAGIHTISVEYFESGGHANIKVWAEKTTFVSDKWRAEYYTNFDLRDPAFLVRQDEAIDFDWGNGSPAYGIDGNNFSVRWRKTLYFDQGNYRFLAEVGDRDQVKIYLDGWLIVDKYRESAGTVEGYFANVGAGNHTVTVTYQEDVGQAKIRVRWERVP